MSREDQESICRWMYETFPGVNPDSPRKSIRALEEMVELCLASGASEHDISNAVGLALFKSGGEFLTSHKRSRGHREGSFDPAKIPAEAADVLIVLYGVAGMRGFDLHAEVDRKMAVNRSRTWAARGDGTGYHVEREETGHD